jgi:hypothetical protein
LLSLPAWVNRKTCTAAVLCVGAAAIVLHPAGLILFGLGAYCGCRGRRWLRQYFH